MRLEGWPRVRTLRPILRDAAPKGAAPQDEVRDRFVAGFEARRSGALLRELQCAIAHRRIHNHRREYGPAPRGASTMRNCASGNDGNYVLIAQPLRKNPPRISADGFRAKQFTLNKTPCLTGPVNEDRSIFPQLCKRSAVGYSMSRSQRITPSCAGLSRRIHVLPRSKGVDGRDVREAALRALELVGRITIRRYELLRWRVTPSLQPALGYTPPGAISNRRLIAADHTGVTQQKQTNRSRLLQSNSTQFNTVPPKFSEASAGNPTKENASVAMQPSQD
jgi:hypothetical protein